MSHSTRGNGAPPAAGWAVALLALSLAACAGDGDPAASDTAADTATEADDAPTTAEPHRT